MDNKDYRENQKVQRKEFKKYRKHMWKVIIWLFVAVASAFIFPNNLLVSLNKFLKLFLSEYLAGSITVFTQIIGMFGGVLVGLVNVYKATKAKDAIEESQSKEEDIVDSLIDEKEELLKKIDEISKAKEKINTETKAVTKTNNYNKSRDELIEEKPKVKKYTR